MKKLFLKGFIFLILILTVNGTLNLFLSPFWGHPNLVAKDNNFTTRASEFNTVFIGTSRFYKHIIPHQFDSLNRAHGVITNSYNLGVNSFQYPQMLKPFERILESNTKIDYYFIELTHISDEITNKLLNNPEYYYWYSFRDFYLMTKHMLKRKDVGKLNKIKFSKQYLQSWLGNVFHIGIASYYCSEFQKDYSWINNEFDKNNGFVSFESAMNLDARTEREDNLINRRLDFLKDTSVLDKRILSARNFDKMRIKNGESPFEQELKRLINLAESKGAKVFIVVAPMLLDYDKLHYFKNILNNEMVLDFSSPDRYPLLYETYSSFDRAHLNLIGAKYFTTILSNEFWNFVDQNRLKEIKKD